jgi:hypothetical protein
MKIDAMELKFEITKVNVALIAGVCVVIGIIEYTREASVRDAETALKQTRSVAACVKEYGQHWCDKATKNLLARETRIDACRDAQRAVEALTSDTPGRLDDAVKACRG